MASLLYISGTSRMPAGDQSRSAIAAVRGQILESMVSGVTHSDHMVASPPLMRARSSAVSGEVSGMGSAR